VEVDPFSYTTRLKVRQYELDANGHVNNAVYLNYAEHVTVEHAELSGFGAEWAKQRGGAWVIHRSEVIYHSPATVGDELELTVKVLMVKGVRGLRKTTITKLPDQQPVAEVLTEWVWISKATGLPSPLPSDIVEVYKDLDPDPSIKAWLRLWKNKRQQI